MSARPRLVTFTSDYGTEDEFVGVCHAVIARIAPDVRVIDMTHGIRGIRAGAAVLAQSVGYAPADAVHLAIVDPGVGTRRRAIVIASGSGALLVGPDNGLLVEAAEALGGAASVHQLQDPRFRLDPVSATFHGRDVFAPAAAHLAAGTSAASLGPALDAAGLVRLSPAHLAISQGVLEADVLRADRFGNLQLAATAADLELAGLSARVLIQTSSQQRSAKVGRTFAEVAAGELLVLIDSAGHVAVAANLGSADEILARPPRLRISTAH